MAELLSMESTDINTLYHLYVAEKGDTSAWKVTPKAFLEFIEAEVLTDETMTDSFDEESAKQLSGVKALVDAVMNDTVYEAKDLATLMEPLSEDMEVNSIEVVYLLYGGMKERNPEWKLTMEELFTYLSEEFVKDERFVSILDEKFTKQIADAQEQMDDATDLLVGDNYSLMMISASLPEEGEETSEFMRLMEEQCEEQLQSQVYMIGNTPMAYEMSKTFDAEMNKITILTALSIYIVVLFTFKNAVICIWLPKCY